MTTQKTPKSDLIAWVKVALPILFAVLVGLIGWIASGVRDRITDIEEDLQQLSRQTIRQSEYKTDIEQINSRLLIIENRLYDLPR